MNAACGLLIIHDKFKKACSRLISQTIYKGAFAHLGKHTKIIKPLTLRNVNYISIGDYVTIGECVTLMAETGNHKPPRVSIGNQCTIGNYNHIVGFDELIIEDNVLTADRVYISDNYHGYEDIHVPIVRQKVKSKGITRIGRDSWIGENSVIISSNIGQHCIVAANSVVNKDVPDYCLVAGCPATIRKRYDMELEEWVDIKNA